MNELEIVAFFTDAHHRAAVWQAVDAVQEKAVALEAECTTLPEMLTAFAVLSGKLPLRPTPPDVIAAAVEGLWQRERDEIAWDCLLWRMERAAEVIWNVAEARDPEFYRWN